MHIETEDWACSVCWAEVEPNEKYCQPCREKLEQEELRDIQFEIDCAQGKI